MPRPRKSEEEKLARKRAYNREYQRAHRAQNNLARKRWREAHPEEGRKRNTESHRKWQQANRERYNAYQREWRARRKAKLAKEQQA